MDRTTQVHCGHCGSSKRAQTARLFTTRDTGIASMGRAVNVDQMSEREAVLMLTVSANLEAKPAKELSQQLGEWPLALELASSMIRARVRQGESPSAAEQRLRKIIVVGALKRCHDNRSKGGRTFSCDAK